MAVSSNPIHPTAIVHSGAKLGTGVTVGPYSVIDEHVSIGEGTVINSHCVITGRTTMGKRNRVFTGAVIGSEPQDVKYNGETCFWKSATITIFASM